MSRVRAIVGAIALTAVVFASPAMGAETIFRFASEDTKKVNLDPISATYSFWLT